MLRLTLLVVSLLLLAYPAAEASKLSQIGPPSITIGPSTQTASPGETVSIWVSVSTLDRPFSGYVLVTMSQELTVAGQPICSSGCRQPYTVTSDAGDRIETNIDISSWERASFSFEVTVSPDAPEGESLGLTAQLLGGQSLEQSFAQITVGPSPKVEPIERDVRLTVTPTQILAAPGASWLYYIQPVFWGMWEGQFPDLTVDLQLPSGVTVQGEPVCSSSQPKVPLGPTCDVVATTSEESTLLSLRPGKSSDSVNAIYVTVEAGTDVPVGAVLEGSVSFKFANGQHSVDQGQQPLYVTVVNPDSVPTSNETSTIHAVIEVQEYSSGKAGSCNSDRIQAGNDVSLIAWGGDTYLSTTTFSTGQLQLASDGSGEEVCRFSIKFHDVPAYSIYIVGLGSPGDILCRACVLGLVSSGTSVIQILPGYFYP